MPFASWDELTAARADPASAGAGEDAEAVEGVMLKRRDALYLPGRPKGLWWKWKRDPHVIDAVLMYAQRGHGKRSSFYSDYTFGVWAAGESGDELVPVGKAYFGFTDEELTEIDRYVRRNTVNRFGPVREVTHEADNGLVMEVAFEGLQRSTRHKSGVAMRFPRISRLRWDKPPREADRLETLEKMLDGARFGHRSIHDSVRRDASRDCDVEHVVSRFLGGPPLAVCFRLVLLCVLVGVILSALGFDPGNIIDSIRRMFQAHLGHGLRRRALGVALFPARRHHRRSRSG